MNIRVRNARLQGVAEAHRILDVMEARKRLDETDGQVDVFGILADLDIFVMFKPLDGLLGAFLKQETPGVLISTKRPHSVQRFTGAHELGHAVLNHDPSLDSPGVIRRAAAGVLPRGGGDFKSYLQEVEADAFAGELLTPRWLLVHHAKRQGWTVADLADPDTAYQLALRCGCSYEATLRSLSRNRILTDAQVESALVTKPKTAKASVRGAVEWLDPWSDVWRLTGRDLDQALPVAAGDTVRLELRQNAAAGFRWRAVSADAQFHPLSEEVRLATGVVGAPSERLWFYRAEGSGPACATYVHRRSWETGQEAETAALRLNIRPAESGLSRAQRARLAIV